jgi:hypothetical protein
MAQEPFVAVSTRRARMKLVRLAFSFGAPPYAMIVARPCKRL